MKKKSALVKMKSEDEQHYRKNDTGNQPGPNSQDGVFNVLTDDHFQFECRPDISCFTRCCRDLKLVLTPYDVLRLVQRLALSSQEFVDRWTLQERDETTGYPRLYLRMSENNAACPFVTAEGCSVYTDRPGACRLYPIGRASRPRRAECSPVEEWFFMVREPHCRGFEEPRRWTIKEWFINQGVDDETKSNDRWMSIVLREPIATTKAEREKKMQMFFMASYQLDIFSDFVFSTSFQRRFTIPRERRQLMGADPRELLDFAIDWLLFCLFGEPTITITQS